MANTQYRKLSDRKAIGITLLPYYSTCTPKALTLKKGQHLQTNIDEHSQKRIFNAAYQVY